MSSAFQRIALYSARSRNRAIAKSTMMRSRLKSTLAITNRCVGVTVAAMIRHGRITARRFAKSSADPQAITTSRASGCIVVLSAYSSDEPAISARNHIGQPPARSGVTADALARAGVAWRCVFLRRLSAPAGRAAHAAGL